MEQGSPNTAKSNLLLIAIAFALPLSFTSCGGGGGNGSAIISSLFDVSNENVTQIRRATSDIQRQVLNFEIPDPQFGSVTQSTRLSAPGGTATAETEASDDRFILKVRRNDGSSLTIDTAGPSTIYVTSQSTRSITGRQSFVGYVASGDAGSGTLAAGMIDWNSNDLTDYMAAGYWIHIEGDLAAERLTEVEVGVFADGPEFRGTPSLPSAGSAAYSGVAGGLYVAKFGTEFIEATGSVEMGEYLGQLRLTADFTTSRISGSINNIGLYGVHVTNGDEISPVPNTQTDYQIMLDSLTINSNGQFSGAGVRPIHPELSISSSEGKWGGRFSTKNDRNGNPRAVGGTLSGIAKTAGGSEAGFIGGFLGATSSF